MMPKKLFVVLLVSVCCFSLGFCGESEKQVDPYENTSILVEAFVVRVSTEALAEVGVSPIGQAPDGISVLKIAACLSDLDQGEVLSGAKVNCRHRNGSETKDRQTHYIAHERKNVTKTSEGPVESTEITYKAYQSGTNFEVRAYLKSQEKISLEYNFSFSTFDESEGKQSPPDLYSFDWNGILIAQPGMPIIAGAGQNDESVTFLILCATIQE